MTHQVPVQTLLSTKQALVCTILRSRISVLTPHIDCRPLYRSMPHEIQLLVREATRAVVLMTSLSSIIRQKRVGSRMDPQCNLTRVVFVDRKTYSGHPLSIYA